jgi:hypothetical protein
MKFDFDRRQGEFGTFKNRWEKPEEQGAKKKKTIDLPVRIPLRPKELDMLVPPGADGQKLSRFMYGENLRKPQLQTHLLSPMLVHRKPENISFTIYDVPNDKRKSMTFEQVLIKDPKLDFQDTTPYLSFVAKIQPTWEQFLRIGENVENCTCDFDCFATAPELFDKPGDDEGTEGKDDSGQADMVGGGDDKPTDEDDE